eukprot:750649-Hanusia_phi.AAC.6
MVSRILTTGNVWDGKVASSISFLRLQQMGDAQLPVISESAKEANDNDDEFFDDKVTQNHLR